MTKNAERIAVFGRSGAGKSTATKALIKGGRPKMIAYDTMEEYEGRGWRICTSLHDVFKAMKSTWPRGFKISYRPATRDHVQNVHDLAQMCFLFQEPYRQGADDRKLTLVIEEADLSIPNKMLPADQKGIQDATLRGRHFGIEIIAVSQRPALVSAHFRGNVSRTYVFPLSLHDDRKAIGQVIGQQHLRTVTELQNYQFILIENGSFVRGETTRRGGISVRT